MPPILLLRDPDSPTIRRSSTSQSQYSSKSNKSKRKHSSSRKSSRSSSKTPSETSEASSRSNSSSRRSSTSSSKKLHFFTPSEGLPKLNPSPKPTTKHYRVPSPLNLTSANYRSSSSSRYRNMSSPTKKPTDFSLDSTKGLPMPGLSGTANSAVGNLLKGAVTEDGKLKDAALMVGIKLDLEAEVHLTARVRGDILVGLY